MKNKTQKILSLLLVIIYAVSTLGFVIDQNNCKCCETNCTSEIKTEQKVSCCSVKPEPKSCCAEKQIALYSSGCMCEKIKCNKSDYVKSDHKTITQSSKIFVLSIKSLCIEIIDFIDENKSDEIIKFLKTDPPPILVKDSSYIIELSKLKIPACNLV
ncbi:MAG: hypothetical protein ACEPO8_07375 [Rhodothermaceae bacterium]